MCLWWVDICRHHEMNTAIKISTITTISSIVHLQYVHFGNWLFFSQHKALRCPQVVSCISSSFLFIAEQYSIVWLAHNLFIHSPIEGHLPVFSFWLVMVNFVYVCVMVNFMCQLDWITWCSDIWSDLILIVSGRVFWMSLTIKLVDSIKQTALLSGGGPHSISWRPEQNEKADFPPNRGSPPAWLPWAEIPVFPTFTLKLKHQLFLGFRPSDSEELHHWFSSVSNSSTLKLWPCQPPWSCEPISYEKSLSLNLSLDWFCFSEEFWLIQDYYK